MKPQRRPLGHHQGSRGGPRGDAMGTRAHSGDGARQSQQDHHFRAPFPARGRAGGAAPVDRATGIRPARRERDAEVPPAEPAVPTVNPADLPPLGALTLDSLLLALPGRPQPSTVTTLALPSRSITELPPGLGSFGVLRRLDFSRNALTSCRPLASLRCAETLSHIDLSHNALTDLSAIRMLQLPNLVVLNVSNNKLKSLASLWEEQEEAEGSDDDARRGSRRGEDSRRRRRDNLLGGGTLANLKALIASHNEITSITGLEQYCTSLETLVISHNPVGGAEPAARVGGRPIDDDDTQGIPDWSDSDAGAFDEGDAAAEAGALVSKDEAFWRCVSSLGATLKKLSASSCGLVGIHPRSKLPRVTELRLSHNAIVTVPATVRFKSLQILDVATNNIATPEPLRRFPFLRQLNLMGNPLSAPFDDDAFLTTQWAPASFEGLTLVDGRKVVPLASEDARRTARREVLKAVRTAEEAEATSEAATGAKVSAPRRRVRLAPDEIPLGQEVDVVLDASKVAAVSAVEARKVVVSVKSRGTAQQAGRRGASGVAGADAAKALETAAASAFQPW